MTTTRRTPALAAACSTRMQVGERGNEVQAQTKAFSPIAVVFAQQAKDLQAADGVLDDHAPGVNLTVRLLLLAGERSFLGGFSGFAAVGVELLQTLVTGVGEHFHGGMHPGPALLVEA